MLKKKFNNLLSKEVTNATLIGVAGAKYAATICSEQKQIKRSLDEKKEFQDRKEY